MSDCYSRFEDHIKVRVRLTPKAHIDTVDGVEVSADEKPYLKARVRAVPEKGNANKALEKLLASYFNVPKSAVEVVSGTTSRLKTVSIAGNPDDLMLKRFN